MDRRAPTVQSEQPVQDEISIREIIETLWKGKIIISLITVIAVIMSAVISFFVLPEQFQAQVVLEAKPFDLTIAASDVKSPQNSIIESLTKLPSMTIENYIMLAKSPAVLQKTIEKHEMKDANGQYIDTINLSRSITIANKDGSNYIEINVTGSDPVQAALIANSLSQSLIEYVTTNSREHIQQSADLIDIQLTNEENKLSEKSKALTDYLKNNGSVDVLKGEINNLISQIVNYKKNFRETETEISADFETLKTLSAAVPSTSGINLSDFQINTNLTSDPTTEQTVEQPSDQEQIQLNLASNKLSAALILVDINKIQTRLVSNTYKKLALQTKITEMSTDLTADQSLLIENEYKYNAIVSEMEMAKLSYDAYLQRFNEIMLFVNADIGKTSINIATEAYIPEAPVSPNKMMNILIAAVLGFLMSVFVVLFIDYWKKSMVKTAA